LTTNSLSSIPTKILPPNPTDADSKASRTAHHRLGLNDRQIEHLTHALQAREYDIIMNVEGRRGIDLGPGLRRLRS